jgi:hypothetical protein
MCSGAHPRDISNHHVGEEGHLGGVVRWEEQHKVVVVHGVVIGELMLLPLCLAATRRGRGSMEATEGPDVQGVCLIGSFL